MASSPAAGVFLFLSTYGLGVGVCDHSDPQSNHLREARRKSSSTQLSTRCQFRILGSDPRQLILGIFKYSTDLERSFLGTVISVPCAQYSLRHGYIETLFKVHMTLSIKKGSVDGQSVLS